MDDWGRKKIRRNPTLTEVTRGRRAGAVWNISLDDLNTAPQASTSKSAPEHKCTSWDINFDNTSNLAKPKLPERLAKRLESKVEKSMLGKGTFVIRRYPKGERPKLNNIFPLPTIRGPEPKAKTNKPPTPTKFKVGTSKTIKGNTGFPDMTKTKATKRVLLSTSKNTPVTATSQINRNKTTIRPVRQMTRNETSTSPRYKY